MAARGIFLLLVFVTPLEAIRISHNALGNDDVGNNGFTTYEDFQKYIATAGVQYVELGSSHGGSRRALEDRLQARNQVKLGCPAVLGLDIDDNKLAECNKAEHLPDCPLCVKADLRDIVRGHSSSEPLLEGTNMVDILEHINLPVDPAAVASVPYSRLRQLHGQWFDTASHTTTLELWTAACLLSKRSCFMAGPGFDNEDAIRELGYIPYYAQWSGHTAHLNSTSMISAIAKLPSTRKAAKIVMLSQQIHSTADSWILRLPPNQKEQACSSGDPAHFSLACDRHAYGSREEMALKEKKEDGFKYEKDMGDRVNLTPMGIYKRMHALVAFDVDPTKDGQYMSRETAKQVVTNLLEIPEDDRAVLVCELPGQAFTSTEECARKLLQLAKQTLAQ